MSKKRNSSSHNKVVNSVLAAALAFTAIVSTVQLANVNDDLVASVTGRVATSHEAPPPDGGGGTPPPDGGSTPPPGDSMITCPDGSQVPSGSTCPTSGGTPPPDGGMITCPDGSQVPSGSTCPTSGDTSGTTTPPAGSGASSYVTQPTCQGAGYSWGINTNACYNTALDRDTAEGGGTATQCGAGYSWDGTACQPDGGYTYPDPNTPYPAGACSDGTSYPAGTGTPPCSYGGDPYGGAVDTVDACQGRGGQWYPASSTCSVPRGGYDGTSGDSTGTYCNSSGCEGQPGYDPNADFDGTTPCNSSGCLGDPGYDSTRTDYPQPGAYDPNQPYGDTQTGGGFYCNSAGRRVTSGEECGCYDFGGTWANGTCSGVSATGDFAPGTQPYGAPQQCAEGQYFDFREGRCNTAFQQDQFFNDDFYGQFDHFTCPEWDTRCQQDQQAGQFNFGQDAQFGWEQESECLDAGTARQQKSQIEQQIKEFEKQFNKIDLREAGDLYSVASGKSQLDKLKSLDLNDPCELGKGFQFLEGADDFRMELDGAREISHFKDELKRIIKEIAREKSRVQSEEAKELLAKAEAKANELLANPPVAPEEPWKLWESLDPECMRFAPPMMPMGGFGGGAPVAVGGGGFGGPPQFGCSVDDLIESDTPRGYFMAAMRTDGETRFASHAEGMCRQAAQHIAMFEKMAAGVPGASALTEEGKRLAVACEAATDKFAFMEKFEKLGRKAEALMASAGIDPGDAFDDEDMEQGFDFGDVGALVGDDLMAKIEALIDAKIKEATNKVAIVLQEKLAKLVGIIETRALEAVTSVMEQVSGEIADHLAGQLDVFSVLSKTSSGAVNTITEKTGGIIESLNTIVAAAPEAKSEAEDLTEAVAEKPLPIVVLAQVEDLVKDAASIAENGDDPSNEIDEALDLIRGIDEEELTKLQINDGTAFAVDVPYGKYWGGEADAFVADAFVKGVVEGTENDEGYSELRPEVTLNVTEGITMMVKAADMDLPSTGAVTQQVKDLVGSDATWAYPYVQAAADEIGFNKVQEAFLEAGGAGGTMTRANFADVAVSVGESIGGTVAVSTDSQIGHYVDYGQMSEDEKRDFAVANEWGMITGANGGTEANFEAGLNRLEAAKTLAVLHDVVSEAGDLADVDVSGFEGLLEDASRESGDPSGG